MEKIKTHLGQEKYKIEIKSATNTIIADEPVEKGGKDLGFSPKELLASALGACTSATVKIYADYKGWNLTDIKVEVTLNWDDIALKSNITRNVELFGDLDQKQRERLLRVANSCPVHKILSNPVEIETFLK
ncbi:OsmC family protein [Flavobacterium sp. W1B]|uniref:OsmC family protein n=1 Tax=Flavobacterium sp. W1B TaxID=3394146 RepID=UPI0039BCBE23